MNENEWVDPAVEKKLNEKLIDDISCGKSMVCDNSVNGVIDLDEKMTKIESDKIPEAVKKDVKCDENPNTAPDENVSPMTSDGATDLFIGDSELSSSASTPVPPEPFQPKFKVSIHPDDVTKDGELVKYTVSSKKLNSDKEEIFSVLRTYIDFEWLHHTISTGNNIAGIIIPPLPPKLDNAMEKSKKQLGSNARTLLKDEFGKDCQRFQKYLTLLAKHPVFGIDDNFEIFLLNKDTPVHTHVRKGFLNKLSDAMKNRKYASGSDCEEFFSNERKTADNYYSILKSSNENFDNMVSSQLRLCEVLNHLSTAFMLCLDNSESLCSTTLNKLNNLFSRSLKDSKDASETLSINDETTLGSTLDLYTDYLGAEKEMLVRRSCLMVEYENANRNLDKYKSNVAKYNQAVEVKKEAEKNFEQCSDTARQEIKKFHRERILELQQSLVSYAEARLRNARDTCTLLTATMADIKQLKVPSFHENVCEN